MRGRDRQEVHVQRTWQVIIRANGDTKGWGGAARGIGVVRDTLFDEAAFEQR